MKCKYCGKRFRKKKGNYHIDVTQGYSIDGPWQCKEGYHIYCKKLYDKIDTDINVKKALEIIKNNEM